jgi:hypothetical protein
MEEQITKQEQTSVQEPLQPKMSKKKGCLIGGLVVFGVILIIGAIASKCGNDSTSDNGTATSNLISEVKETVKDSVTWDIDTKIDEMTDTKSIWATIHSDNFINQDFPYEGETYAYITVRYMKKYGYDVLIKINQGQIYGASYYGNNYINVRFDQNEPKKYYFNESADGSSETVFLKNHKDFMEKCKTAHDIKIEIPLYQGGNNLFTFHVDKPLVWPED